jgi:hypothetical protein
MSDPANALLSVHRLRRSARKRERELQAWLDGDTDQVSFERGEQFPVWAHGVRVQKVGRFQFCVYATRERGH